MGRTRRRGSPARILECLCINLTAPRSHVLITCKPVWSAYTVHYLPFTGHQQRCFTRNAHIYSPCKYPMSSLTYICLLYVLTMTSIFVPSKPSFPLGALGAKALVVSFDQDVDRCVDQHHHPTRHCSVSSRTTITMDGSRDLSDSHDVMRTAQPLTIVHHPTPHTRATPDLISPVIEFNRSLRVSHGDHGFRNKPALTNAVPRTLGLQPHTDQPQAAAWQQQPPSIDNAV